VSGSPILQNGKLVGAVPYKTDVVLCRGGYDPPAY